MPCSVSPPYTSSTKKINLFPNFTPFEGPFVIVQDIDRKDAVIAVREYPKAKNLARGEWPQFRSVVNGVCPFVAEGKEVATGEEDETGFLERRREIIEDVDEDGPILMTRRDGREVDVKDYQPYRRDDGHQRQTEGGWMNDNKEKEAEKVKDRLLTALLDMADGEAEDTEGNLLPGLFRTAELLTNRGEEKREAERKEAERRKDKLITDLFNMAELEARREEALREEERREDEQKEERRREEEKREAERKEAERKAQEQLKLEEDMRREREKIAVQKREEKLRKAQEKLDLAKKEEERKRDIENRRLLIPFQRQQENARSIVQKGIDEAIKAAEEESKPPGEKSTAQKRTHSMFTNDASGSKASTQGPPKKNAFATMMKAAKTIDKGYTQPAYTFTNWIKNFEDIIKANESNSRRRDDSAEAAFITETLLQTLQDNVLQFAQARSAHTQTKTNGLHALIEVATAISEAPRGTVQDALRRGRIPAFLVDKMWHIVSNMTKAEFRSIAEEQAFIYKVRELRQAPRVEWEGDTWNGLDEILRVVDPSGPCDFRRIYSEVKASTAFIKATHAATIAKFIRTEFQERVNASDCFEKKYNALNALVDIGIHFADRDSYQAEKPKVAIDSVSNALFAIAKMLQDDERNHVVREALSTPRYSEPSSLMRLRQTLNHSESYYYSYSDSKREAQKALKLLVDEFKRAKTSKYGNNGLLLKVYYLRWHEYCIESDWTTTRNTLDDLIEMFTDSSAIQDFNDLMNDANRAFTQSSYDSYYSERPTKSTRSTIDRTIDRIILRSPRRACAQTKINALSALSKIGLGIMKWKSSHLHSERNAFEDQLTEDSLTEAMITICHSLIKSGDSKYLSDKTFVDVLKQLDGERAKIAEAMEGLDAILDLLDSPDIPGLGTRSVKSKQPEVFIDLTDD